MTNRPVTVVIAPDSYKGSLSAAAAAEAMKAGVLRACPAAEVRLIPMADGGEGTLDAVLHGGGERWLVRVRNAGGSLRDVSIGLLPDGSGMIEVAEIVGLTDPAGTATPVGRRSSAGVGDAIRLLLDHGCRRIMVGLGGSSTNDGGSGMMAALGVRLLDAAGEVVEPVPEELGRVARVEVDGIDPRVSECAFLALSDVQNPLNGANGATAVFGRQKGVRADEVLAFDANLLRFAELIEEALGVAARDLPGSGAAGGLGFGLRLLGAEVQSGGEVVADLLGMDAALAGADWAVTGEGRSDLQTLEGKAPFVVCRRARAVGIPVTLLSGAVEESALAGLGEHFAGCFSIVPGPMTKGYAIAHAEALVTNAAEQMVRLFVSGGAKGG